MNDPETGNPAQGVIARVGEASAILVSRLGRRVSVPRRSFDRSWRFILNAPNEMCSHVECPSSGYLQIQQLGNWAWVCEAHLPAGMAPLLPGERPGRSNDRETFTACPGCNTTFNRVGSGARSVGGHTVWTCGACRSEWVQLIGHGIPTDGSWFGIAIQEAAGILEGEGTVVRCLIGSVALLVLGRAVGRLSDPPSIGGVPLLISDVHGSNNAIVLGERPSTGIQRLGGQPNCVAPELPPRNLPVINVPVVGSAWRTQPSPGIVIVVIGVTSTRNGFDRTTTHRIRIQEIAAIDANGSVVGAIPSPQLGHVLDLDTFNSRYEVLDQSVLNGIEFTIDPLGTGTITTAEWRGDFNQTYSVGEPEPKMPLVGELWWFKDQSASVVITEIGRTEANSPFVKIRERNGIVTALSPKSFYERFIQKDATFECKVGDCYTDSIGRFWTVRVISPRIVIANDNGHTLEVTEGMLRLGYQRFERKSIYDFIGSDEEWL